MASLSDRPLPFALPQRDVLAERAFGHCLEVGAVDADVRFLL
jgi:hypothetical protein